MQVEFPFPIGNSSDYNALNDDAFANSSFDSATGMALGLHAPSWEAKMTTHQLGGMLLQYARASRQQLFPNIAADFRAVANTVSQEELRRALASTLQAEPAEVVAELFRLSDLHQRVAVIQILTSLMEGGSLGLLANAGVLGFPPSPRTVAPQVAMQLAPDAVARLVADAAAQDSSLIDRIAAFYAQNPKVIARLPASALVHIMHDLASGTLGNASGRP